MPLEAGKKLGPYEVVAQLGAGGMGEVYRARDTRLNRTVAIKVLPAALAKDAELRARFEREARSLSSLTHPNICTLHDIGHQDGIDFLVMEYIEGESLADRLTRSTISFDKALQCAVEIADALEKAHRSGLVHRDLKPGNIMLTRSGAKLLDFGLAKPAGSLLSGGGAETVHVFDSPTRAEPLTQTGTVLGTYPYISPEQLEGKDADARSDIFSFGCVLYEIFTGYRAFQGKSPASVIAAILNAEPPPMTQFQTTVPPVLERVVRVCLSKDPDERWQTAHDVKLQLKGIAEGGTATRLPSAQVAALPAAPPAPQRTSRELLAWILAGVFLAAAIGAGYMAWRKGAATMMMPPAAPVSAALLLPDGLSINLAGKLAGPPAVSPDGTSVVFSAVGPDGKAQLWLRALKSDDVLAIAGTDGGAAPFWSPDGEWIGFFVDGKLKKIKREGGAPITICDAVNGRGGTWNSNGDIVFAPSYQSGLSRVSANGAAPIQLTKVDVAQHSTHRWPVFLPDGNHFVYLAAVHFDAGREAENTAMLGSLDGKVNKVLVQTRANVAYSAGNLLFVRDRALMAQPLDVASGILSGQAILLADGIRHDSWSWVAAFAASPTGTLVYQTGAAYELTSLTWVDRGGKLLGRVGDKADYGDLRLSPDGKKVAVEIGLPGDIYVMDTEKGTRWRFTFGGDDNEAAPVWSPDGKTIAYGLVPAAAGSAGGIFTKASNGAGSEEHLLPATKERLFPQDWSADGKTLVYVRSDALRADRSRIWYVAADEMHADEKAFSQENAFERDAQLSPNGRFVVYTSRESGREEVFISSFPDGKGKWQVSQNGGELPRWRRDGKEVFYLAADGRMMGVGVNTGGASLEVGATAALFAAHAKVDAIPYDVTADGQRFLINRIDEKAPAAPVRLVLNWPAWKK